MEQKYYMPSSVIVNLFNKMLHKSKTDKEAALNRRMKLYVLDSIFQSMANLIYFLEQIDTHPKLKKYFEKDLKELLDVRPYRKAGGLPTYTGPVNTGILIPQTNLIRLIYASIIPYEKDYKNFRLALLTQIQTLVYEKMCYIMQQEYGTHSQATKAALDDIERAVGWVSMLSKPKEFVNEYPKRVINFKAPYRTD